MTRWKTAEERFWDHVNRNGPVPSHRPELGSCWLWTGRIVGKGYGVFKPDGHMMAHRFSWLLHGGQTPAAGWYHPVKNTHGMQLNHLCYARNCVNPTHLELLTPTENKQKQRIRRDNTSSVKGVTWRPNRGKWELRVQRDGQRRFVGLYNTIEEAQAARKEVTDD